MQLQLFFLIEKIYFVDLFPMMHHVQVVGLQIQFIVRFFTTLPFLESRLILY